MTYLSEIFCRHTWDVCSLVPNNFKFLVCLSVCSLPHFLTKIPLSVKSLVRGTFLDVSALVQKRFLVCLSVCSLPHFLTKIMLSSSRWAIFLKISAELSVEVMVRYHLIVAIHTKKLCYLWKYPNMLNNRFFSTAMCQNMIMFRHI